MESYVKEILQYIKEERLRQYGDGTLFWQHFQDATGEDNFATNYSGQTNLAFCGPAAGKTWYVKAFHFKLQDSANFPAAGYGGIAAPGLPNGISARIVPASGATALASFPTTDRVLSNADWHMYADRAELVAYGVGDNILVGEVTFDAPIKLVAPQRFEVLLNDDFSALVDQHFHLHGVEYAT